MSKTTKQRRAIAAVLADAERPLTVQSVYERVRKDIPGVGIATIYRNLGQLADEGHIARIVGLVKDEGGRQHHGVSYGTRAMGERAAFSTLYQVGAELYLVPPDGFVRTRHVTILLGTVPVK